MEYTVTALSHKHLDGILSLTDSRGVSKADLIAAYFSAGSVSYCLLADGKPVAAGGIVNLMWKRGEAWLLVTPFFKRHVKDCYRHIRNTIPRMAQEGKFKRVQATCDIMQGASRRMFTHLGFTYEGTMRHFGPGGETCYMYSRLF